MSESWEDYETPTNIKKWRDEKVTLVMGEYKTEVSCRILMSIMLHLFHEGMVPLNERYDTKYVEGRGFIPPILQEHQKDPQSGKLGARERLDEEIFDMRDDGGRGITIADIRAYRKEADELNDALEKTLKICPRCKCPEKHCSDEC